MRLFAFLRSRLVVAWALCVIMTLPQVAFGGEISTQLHQTSFIDVPQSSAFAKPNATAEFVWEMKNCLLNGHWRVKLLTELYDLYPISQGQGSIKPITDYNATARCRDNSTIVTLSIVFNENVLENAEYVVCRVMRLEDRVIVLTHMVNFSSTEPATSTNPSTETTSNSESSSIINSTDNNSMIVVSTSGSVCKQCVHFSTLVVCLFVATFLAFSWKSCY